MNTHISILGILFIVLVGFSCLGKRTNSPEKDQSLSRTLPIQEIASGNYCGIADFQNLCIDDEAEWKKYWGLIHNQTIPVPKLPEINFEENMVIASFMGSKNSGGYSARIDEVVWENESYVVRLTHISPGNSCFNTMAITQPYIIVQIPRPKEAGCSFEQRDEMQDC